MNEDQTTTQMDSVLADGHHAEKPALPKLLLPGEAGELAACEVIIERGLETFIEVGLALTTVRDKRLYREQFGTFAEYCEERWAMGVRQAQRMMAGAELAADLVESLGNDATPGSHLTVPAGEAQVRPLLSLAPEHHREVWAEVCASASNGRPTRRQVEAAVADFKARHGLAGAKTIRSAESPESDADREGADRLHAGARVLPRREMPVVDVAAIGGRDDEVRVLYAEALAATRRLMEKVRSSVALPAALNKLDEFGAELAQGNRLRGARQDFNTDWESKRPPLNQRESLTAKPLQAAITNHANGRAA